MLSENDDRVIANVGKAIFYKGINGNCTLGKDDVLSSITDIGMNMSTDGKRDWSIYKSISQNGEKLIDDYYNFVNLSVHEEEHGKGKIGRYVFEHVFAEITAINHPSFDKMTNAGKAYAAETLRFTYAEHQRGHLLKYLRNS